MPITRILVGLLLLIPASAHAADIGFVALEQAECDSLTISITLNSNWTAVNSSNHATYRVSRVFGASDWTFLTESDDSIIQLKQLQEFESYDLVVSARSKRSKIPSIVMYRQVGELKAVTTHCATVTPTTPAAGDVRLRHEATGKCLFGPPINGRAVSTWGCWKDPEMAVVLEPLGGSEMRIRLRRKGKCLYGNPTNGGEVKSWGCWNDPNMVYVREDLGNSRVRLRHKATGECMYGSNQDGRPVKNWPCWNDPNMVWVLDPFF